MLLQLSKTEQELFDRLAHSQDGVVLCEFIERAVRQIESIRTKTDLSNEARVEISNFLEENFLKRMDRAKEPYKAPDGDECD